MRCHTAVTPSMRPQEFRDATRAGIIDRSFGFMTAVSEATRAIEAARTEAESNQPNGIGVVKLMGRSAGFLAAFATLASQDVDLCLVPEVPIVPGAASQQGVVYNTADGHELANLGEQNVCFKTAEGHDCTHTWQVADVKRPLLSVTALTSKGCKVAFTHQGGEIRSPDGTRVTRFGRKRGVYVLDIWVPVGPPAAPFTRQGAR